MPSSNGPCSYVGNESDGLLLFVDLSNSGTSLLVTSEGNAFDAVTVQYTSQTIHYTCNLKSNLQKKSHCFCSVAQVCPALCDPMACQASLSLTMSQSWPKFMFIASMMLSTARVQLQQPGIQPEEMDAVGDCGSLSFFSGLPVYSKFKILFYTFTKTLGQRFDIFGSPSPRFIISINHCCSSNRVPASVILSESALSSII